MPLAQALLYILQMQGSAINMLRITENAENGKTVRLRLDGTVNSVSYVELEAACSRHQESAGKVILVDMAGVVFMNNEVASKLAGLRSEQLRIINCSPFIKTLLNTVERDQKNQQ
jgi:anti-anti-sigma regulatory factor